MPAITFMPMNRTVEVTEGTPVLNAALAGMIPIDTACGGKGLCRTCRISVEKGMAHLSPMDEVENRILPRPTPIHPFRLACQARIEGGPITVTLKPIY